MRSSWLHEKRKRPGAGHRVASKGRRTLRHRSAGEGRFPGAVRDELARTAPSFPWSVPPGATADLVRTRGTRGQDSVPDLDACRGTALHRIAAARRVSLVGTRADQRTAF